MQVKKRVDGRWRAWGWSRGKRFDALAGSKRLAEQRLKEKMITAAAEDPAPVVEDVLVEEVVERYLAQLDIPRTAARRRAAWKRHAGALADLQLRSLSVREVAVWRDRLRLDPRRRDTEFALATLRAAVDLVVEAGDFQSNPCRALRRTRDQGGRKAEDAKGPKVYSLDELRELKAAAREERLGGVVVIMADCGLRTGEALGVAWDAIEGDVLHVRQQLREEDGKQLLTDELKTRNSHRSIYIDPKTVEALGEPEDGLVFRSVSGGPVWRRAVRSMWTRIHREAGIDPAGRNLYSLRHSHASALVAAGEPVTNVARRLGDEPETVLKFYASHLPGRDQTAKTVSGLAGL